MRKSLSKLEAVQTITLVTVLIITFLASMSTHIIHCLAYGKYILLVAGGVCFPLGMIHGIGVWFGAW